MARGGWTLRFGWLHWELCFSPTLLQTLRCRGEWRILCAKPVTNKLKHVPLWRPCGGSDVLGTKGVDYLAWGLRRRGRGFVSQFFMGLGLDWGGGHRLGGPRGGAWAGFL